MEKYIGIAIIAVIMPVSLFATRLLFGKLKNNESKTDYFKPSKSIRQPKAYFWVGFGFVIFCLGMGLFFLFAPDRMIVDNEKGARLFCFIMLLILSIPGFYIILIQLLWKIDIKDSSFIYRNWIGIKREYQFKNVEIVYKTSSTRFYQSGKKIVAISMLQKNYQALELAIET